MNNSPSPSTHETRKFSKARDLSRRLGLCSKTIARWGATGKITAYKLNPRVVLFDDAEVFAFVMAAKVSVERL